MVLSSVTSFIITFAHPSFDFLENTNNKMIKEIKLTINIIEILILSVQILLEFSQQLITSIKSIESHKGKNEVKYKQLDIILDIYHTPTPIF